MRYCKRCVMPDSRPGLKLDGDGVCQACKRIEKRKDIDWNKRRKELEKLVNKYKKNDGANLRKYQRTSSVPRNQAV